MVNSLRYSLLMFFVSLGGCETINQTSQCDPEKNYIISNSQAMDEYKKLKSEGKVRSYFHNNVSPNECNNDKCMYFDKNKYDFIEIYFNDKYRNGVYTIKQYQELDRKDCVTHYKNSMYKDNKYCFVATKNLNDDIKSIYEWKFYPASDGVTKIEFINRFSKTSLFKFSYQTYSTGAIGGPGGGVCNQSSINNPEYKFNPYSFP